MNGWMWMARAAAVPSDRAGRHRIGVRSAREGDGSKEGC